MQTSIALRRYAFLHFVILVLTFAMTSGKHIVAQAEPATADFAAIDTYIEDQIEESHIPGLTLGIVKGDQITHLQAFGEADETGRLLTPQGIADLHRGQFERGVDYAMGWVNNPESGIVWHNGDDGRNHAIIMLAPDQLQAVVLLANVSGLELSIAVDDMAAGVLALLNGEPLPPPSPERSRMKTLYWIGLLIPIVLVVGILWSLISLRRWRRGDGSPTWGWFGWALRVLVPSLLYLAVGWLLFVELDDINIPLSAFRLLNPDFGMSIIISGVLGLVWGILWPVGVYFSLRPTRRQRQDRHVLASA